MSERMCPNEACARYRERTRLMGGCDCGTQLVGYAPPEPTNEQIENCMLALGLPIVPGLMDRNPAAREGGLNFHRMLSGAMNGDDLAAARLQRLLDRVGRAA